MSNISSYSTLSIPNSVLMKESMKSKYNHLYSSSYKAANQAVLFMVNLEAESLLLSTEMSPLKDSNTTQPNVY